MNAPVEFWDVRQVHDLPPTPLEVTDHQCEVTCCPQCGNPNRGQFPSAVQHPIQYGAHLEAWTIYLMVVQLLPSLQICQLLKESFSLSVSEGTL